MTQEDHILIENYLKGLLSDSEKLSFDERLKADVKFNQEFTLEKQLYDTLKNENWSSVDKDDSDSIPYKEALQQERYKELKQTFSEVHSEIDSKPEKNRTLWYYLAAASVVILIVLQVFFNQTVTNQELYYDYANLSELPSFAVRDSNDDVQLQLNAGERAFEGRNYQEALRIFKSTLTQQESNSLLHVYLGLTQVELELYEEAENTFNTLMTKGSQDAMIAHWYQSLLYLKQDDSEKALELLNTIVQDSNHLYFKQASELIEIIKK